MKTSTAPARRPASNSALQAGSTAALVSGLLCPAALSAPGDLDPAFGDIGRVALLPQLNGALWSIEPQNDAFVLAGGADLSHCDYDYNCYEEFSGFASRMSATGRIDPGFSAVRLEPMRVFDVEIQPDGKVVGVGTYLHRDSSRTMTVFRLQPDGALDPGFGNGGIAHLAPPLGALSGHSLTVDPDGRIVVAGLGQTEIVVARLDRAGRLDATFGRNGVFVAAGAYADEYGGFLPRVLRASGGGYRLTLNPRHDSMHFPACQVIGLTADGVLDASFGIGGFAGIVLAADTLTECAALVEQADGRLLVAGQQFAIDTRTESGFVVRLVASGKPDASFDAPAIPGVMAQATALGVQADGSILVAGQREFGVSGALVVRLQADGQLDHLFGDAGSTSFDFTSDVSHRPAVRDLAILPDGGVLLVGGGTAPAWNFVARLLGDAGGESPGVAGIERTDTTIAENEAHAVVTVRRMGGGSQAVSVGYRTRSVNHWNQATPGVDYQAVAGRLTWGDGDRSDREIVVSILDDTMREETEAFSVELFDASGGLRLGTHQAVVWIAASDDDTQPGRLSLAASTPTVTESVGNARVVISRNSGTDGAVSVDLTVVPGSASAGRDYQLVSMTLSWGDGDSRSIPVDIPIVNDQSREGAELFSVRLANPTGGATLADPPTVTITITDDDEEERTGGGSAGGGTGGGSAGGGTGGGGSLGLLSLLLLSAAGVRRPRA